MWASNKYLYSLLTTFIGLSLIILTKSCSNNHSATPIYTIGQDSRWQSLNLMGKERNLSAFNNDLLTEMARQENIRLRIAIIDNFQLLPELERGKLQGILSTLQPSYLNQHQHLLFSEPYFLLGPVLIIRSTAPIESWNEKAKKIIGVQHNASTILNLEQDPSLQIKLYNDILIALSDLSERRIDGIMFPAIPSHIYVKTFYKDELKIITPPLDQEGIRLITLNNEKGKELIQHFNNGLTALKESGIYNELLNQWSLINVEQIDD